jgi:hypothetical protein
MIAGMDDESGRNVPAHRIVITPGIPGYRQPGSGPLLTCDRCGALVMDFRLHDDWHERAGT